MKLYELRDPLVRMLEAFYMEKTIVKDTRDLVLDDTFDSLTELYNRTVSIYN